MIKSYTLVLIAAIFLSACGEKPAEEKKDSVPSANLNPTVVFTARGELITSYEQVYSKTNDRRWVEVYLYVSADSIIETEIEKPSKESGEAPAIYCFAAAKSQLDFGGMKVLDYDAVKEPKGMKKISIPVVSKDNKVLQWVSDPRYTGEKNLDSIWVTEIRVLTKDEAQAKDIMEKLKAEQ